LPASSSRLSYDLAGYAFIYKGCAEASDGGLSGKLEDEMQRNGGVTSARPSTFHRLDFVGQKKKRKRVVEKLTAVAK
jgi:hypothetical protein